MYLLLPCHRHFESTFELRHHVVTNYDLWKIPAKAPLGPGRRFYYPGNLYIFDLPENHIKISWLLFWFFREVTSLSLSLNMYDVKAISVYWFLSDFRRSSIPKWPFKVVNHFSTGIWINLFCKIHSFVLKNVYGLIGRKYISMAFWKQEHGCYSNGCQEW